MNKVTVHTKQVILIEFNLGVPPDGMVDDLVDALGARFVPHIWHALSGSTIFSVCCRLDQMGYVQNIAEGIFNTYGVRVVSA